MTDFARRIIAWQRLDGRHDLPWQGTRDPYRVWLSEVMLQQTQVSSVIPYYQRFLKKFPNTEALAGAPVEEVMQLWAGLGYYARARNLHRTAQTVMERFDGVFPRTFEDVLSLPGVGRSTAAAICAFAYGDRRAILDGNVKRVFARYFALEGDVRAAAREEELWSLAESLIVDLREGGEIESYIQGQMDLGATVCTRSNPSCLLCPLKADCVAFISGRVDELPAARPRKETPHRDTAMLILLRGEEVLLERRPPTGIWGGLWSLPEIALDGDALALAKSRFGLSMKRGRRPEPMPVVEHGFTHYSLSIHPVLLRVSQTTHFVAQESAEWMSIADALQAAIPAPIKRILTALSVSD